MKETLNIMADGPHTPEEAILIHNPHESRSISTIRVHKPHLTHEGEPIKPKLPKEPKPVKGLPDSSPERMAELIRMASLGLDAMESPMNENVDPNLIDPLRQLKDLIKGDISYEDLNKDDIFEDTLDMVAEELASDDEEEDEFEKPPTPEEIKAFEDALREGKINDQEIVGETMHNGMRALVTKDPETERKIIWTLGGGGKFVNLGIFGDPKGVEINTPEKAWKWVEDRILELESSGKLITDQTEQFLVQTIYASNATDSPELMAIKSEAVRRVRARISYHNADYESRYHADKFADQFKSIYTEYHKEILTDTPGVRMAINALSFNNGEYFRLAGAAKTAREGFIKMNINSAIIATGIPMPSVEQINLAFKLGERTLNILGIAADFQGVTDISGTPHHFDDAEKNARYIAEHMNDFDKSTTFTSKSVNIRALMFFPLYLNRQHNRQRGSDELRPYASLFITDARKFTIEGEYKEETNIEALLKGILDESQKDRLADWADSISLAAEGSSQFAGKGKESILNEPLVRKSANAANSDNKESTIPAMMANYEKLSDSYKHLTGVRKQKIMTAWLGLVLEWANTPEARNKGYLGINNFIQQEAIILERDNEKINDTSRGNLLDAMGLHLFINAAWYDGLPEVRKGTFSVFKFLYSQAQKWTG